MTISESDLSQVSNLERELSGDRLDRTPNISHVDIMYPEEDHLLLMHSLDNITLCQLSGRPWRNGYCGVRDYKLSLDY